MSKCSNRSLSRPYYEQGRTSFRIKKEKDTSNMTCKDKTSLGCSFISWPVLPWVCRKKRFWTHALNFFFFFSLLLTFLFYLPSIFCFLFLFCSLFCASIFHWFFVRSFVCLFSCHHHPPPPTLSRLYSPRTLGPPHLLSYSSLSVLRARR